MVNSHDDLLQLRVDSRDGRVVVRLDGELDASNVPVLRDYLGKVLERRPIAVVLDLGDLFFLDSSGVTAILDAHRRAEEMGLSLSLNGPRPFVLKVLELSGITQSIRIEAHRRSTPGRSVPKVHAAGLSPPPAQP
jgi:anti-anti-sigma factor